MRIAFVNNTSIVSGAERSLLELIRALPPEFEPLVLAPPGDLVDRARREAVPVAELPGFESSFRLHPRHTSRGIASLMTSAVSLRRACREHMADLIHANTARAGLIATAARRLGAPPVVTVLRDRLPAGRVGDLTRRGIEFGATAVVANSRFTAAAYHRDAEVVYPPVSLVPAPAPGAGAAFREAEGIDPDRAVIGIVGQITPAKGHHTLVRALAEARDTIPRALLAIVGAVKFDAPGVRHDNRAYLRELQTLIAELSLTDRVRFLGEREDIGAVMSGLDLLALPSEAEPFGRVVIEAMLAGTPVVASGVGGPAEVISDGVDGVLVAPGTPEAWAGGISGLAADAERRAALSERGKARASDFSPSAHAAAMAAVYERVARRRTAR